MRTQTFTEKMLLDSLIKANSPQAILTLNQWRNSINFNRIDSFKFNTYHNFSAYYLVNRNGEEANRYADSAIEVALKSNLNIKKPLAYFNKAASYIYLNKHDSAILLHKYVIKLCDQNGNQETKAKSINSISFNLRHLGKYKESSNWLLSQLKYIKDDESRGVANLHLAMNMVETSVYQNIDFYFKNAIYHLNKSSNKKMLSTAYYEFANYLRTEKRLKEVLQYADSITMFYNADYSKSNSYAVKSNTFYEMKNYSKALTYLDSSFALDTKNGDEYYLLCDYKERGKILYEMGRFQESKESLSKAKNLFANQTDLIMEHEVYKYYLKSSTKLLDEGLHRDLNHYIGLKDSLFQSDMNANILDYTTKYKTVEKESQIKSQQLTIQNEKNNRNLALGGIGFLILIGGGFWYYIRNKQNQKDIENKFSLLTLQQELQSKEIHSLNQQLPTHDLKNLIASFSTEIKEKAPESYNRMNKMLKLTLASLKSDSLLVSIEDQLAQIEAYLYLEKTMFKDRLNYQIDNQLKTDILIPRLLLKNLVENAIKHGIKPKENGGEILVELKEIENYYFIRIMDSGEGKVIELTSDTGIGTSTYRRLFDILNQKNKEKASFEIIPLQNSTEVKVLIPKGYKY